jgi:hypothetical protein
MVGAEASRPMIQLFAIAVLVAVLCAAIFWSLNSID